MRLAQKMGWGALVVLGTIIIVLLLLVVFIDLNRYKETIQALAAQQGISLTLRGDIHQSLLLRPTITATDIDVILPTGNEKLHLHVGKLASTVDVIAALSGRVLLKNIEFIDITSPMLTANGKPLPFTLKAAAAQFDRDTDALTVDGVALQLANITVTAHITGQSLSTSPTIAIDPLMIEASDNQISGKLQWYQIGSSSYGSMNLKSEKLVVSHLTFTHAVLAAVIGDNKITLNNLQADAYQGRISSSGVLTMSGAIPHAVLHASIQNLQLSPLLADMRQTSSIVESGVLQMDADLVTTPMNALVALSSLSGSATFGLENLVFIGKSPEQQVCESAAWLSGQSAPARQWDNKTTIHKLRAEAKMRNGIADVTSLVAKLNAFGVKGSGLINFLNNTLDIPLQLKRMNSQRAADFCKDVPAQLVDVVWPLRCEGSYAVQDDKALCDIDKSALEKLISQRVQ